MAAPCSQLRLLLWKNCVVQLRRPRQTACIIIVPLAMLVLLILLQRYALNTQRHTYVREESFPPYRVESLTHLQSARRHRLDYLQQQNRELYVYFSPNTTAQTNIMERVAKKLDIRLRGFPDEAALLEAQNRVSFQDEASSARLVNLLAAVVFKEPHTPHTVQYALRMPRRGNVFSYGPGSAHSQWATHTHYEQGLFYGPHSGAPGYKKEGFLALQKAVDESIMRELRPGGSGAAADLARVSVQLQRFPFPAYVRDNWLSTYLVVFPPILMLCFFPGVMCLAEDVVKDKETIIRAYMQMMGLRPALHWTSWCIKYLLIFTVTSGLLVGVAKYRFPRSGAILPHCDGTLLFVFFLVYSVTTITFTFAVTAPCSKAGRASTVAVTCFTLSLFLVQFLEARVLQGSPPSSYAPLFLLHNLSLMRAINTVFNWDSYDGGGLTWSRLFSSPKEDDIALGYLLLVLLLDTALYAALAYYLDALYPGRYGVPRPWNFPCKRKRTLSEESEPLSAAAPPASQCFEAPPDDAIPGIRLRNVTKEYAGGGTRRVAVRGVSLDVNTDQITALLGQNGAGKTSTMNIIVGLSTPTHGEAWVGQYSVVKELGRVKRSLGICPQFDCLFDLLTVEEHLDFYSQLKGVAPDAARSRQGELLEALGLVSDRRTSARLLSGGARRKLSVAIALVGDSKFLILDEPTTGLDPSARRETWALLRGVRAGRTVLLSTHSMEEAEAIADRIAIMADGTVRCYGSPLFLKNKYSVGYHLTLVRTPDVFSLDATTALIQTHVPDARLLATAGAEATFTLRRDAAAQFPALLTALEERRVELGVEAWGMAATTLEEVFLKVAMEHGADGEERLLGDADAAADAAGDQDAPLLGNTEDKEARHVPQQLCALLWKRFAHFRRAWLVTTLTTLFPVVFVLLALVWYNPRNLMGDAEAPPLTLTPKDAFADHVVPYIVMSSSPSALLQGLVRHFETDMEALGVRVVNVQERGMSDVSQYVLDVGDKDFQKYKKNLVFGMEFSENAAVVQIVGMYNNEALHSPAILLNIIDNMLLHAIVSPASRVVTVNAPLPRAQIDAVLDWDPARNGFHLDIAVLMYLVLGLSVLVGAALVFIIRERVTGATALQRVSGVASATYWAAQWAWDWARFVVMALCVVVLLKLWSSAAETSFGTGHNGVFVFWVLVNFAWAVLPPAYLFSRGFSSPTSGYNWAGMLHMMLGVFALIACTIRDAVPESRLWEVVDFAGLLLCPPYALVDALFTIAQRRWSASVCEPREFYDAFCPVAALGNDSTISSSVRHCCPELCADEALCGWAHPSLLTFSLARSDAQGLDRRGILTHLLALALGGALYFSLLLLADRPGRDSRCCRRGRQRPPADPDAAASTGSSGPESVRLRYLGISSAGEDADVTAERRRLAAVPRSQLPKTNVVVLADVTKKFGALTAVDRLTVGIDEGECFGLLGANGAGKTTAFRMLTGEERVTSGDAFIGGRCLRTDMTQIWRGMGYCPQTDAMFEYLTVRETLTLFARLKGVSDARRDAAVKTLLRTLLMEDNADKLYKELSGGTRRKVSAAAALLGDPQLLLLDEPTTGLDPVSRRRVWNLVSRVRDTGRTIILTSHSMEECEALCTRITIMVNGQMKCLGSSQELKARFGEGLILSASLRGGPEDGEDVDSRTTAFLSFVHETFPGAKLQSNVNGLVVYSIPCTGSAQIPAAFAALEKARETHGVEDYTLSQTSLEQVFLSLVRAQVAPLERKRGSSAGATWRRMKRTLCCRGREAGYTDIDDNNADVMA